MVRLQIVTLILLVPILQCNSQIFKDTSCGFSLILPKNWTIEKVKSSSECEYGLKYPKWTNIASDKEFDIGNFAIYISVSNGSIEKDGESHACVYEDSIWWFEGRAGARNKAKFIRTDFWNAVIGKSEVGIYKRNDVGYFGAASAFVALLDNRRGKLAEIISDGQFTDKATFEYIVNNLRF
jgi:hypothetical protein